MSIPILEVAGLVKHFGPYVAVDGIDFRETRLYIHRIVESANIYRSLYFAPQP